MADLNIALDDTLYVAHVIYQHRSRWGSQAGQITTKVQTIGPYTTKTAIKGNITRFKKNHQYTDDFKITDIKCFKTEFDWTDTDL